MTWGEGSLFLATRKGVLMLGVPLSPASTRRRRGGHDSAVRVDGGVADRSWPDIPWPAGGAQPSRVVRSVALARSQQLQTLGSPTGPGGVA